MPMDIFVGSEQEIFAVPPVLLLMHIFVGSGQIFRAVIS